MQRPVAPTGGGEENHVGHGAVEQEAGVRGVGACVDGMSVVGGHFGLNC